MIHHTVQQGSSEWHDLRSVIPTASNFHRLIQPAKWEPTKGETRRNYQLELLAARIFGLPAGEQFSSAAMDHGREWEPIARAAYEFERNVTIEDAGFFTDDSQSYGASPDGLIGSDGLIEFKNPENPKVHLSALLDSLHYDSLPVDWTAREEKGSDVFGFVRDHWAQVQGQLLVTGREWCDLVSNFSRLPMVVVRVYPNPVYLAILTSCLDSFCSDIRSLARLSEERGWYRKPKPVVVQDGLEALGVTMADVETIIASRRMAIL